MKIITINKNYHKLQNSSIIMVVPLILISSSNINSKIMKNI